MTTTQDLKNAIAAGAKKFGSRDKYLCSPEYASLYKQWQQDRKPVTKDKPVCEVIQKDGSWVVKVGENRFLAYIAGQGGIFSGIRKFESEFSAIGFCQSIGYTVKK